MLPLRRHRDGGVVKVIYGWHCLECDEKGEGPEADKVAEKHGKGYKHSTVSWMKPDSGPAPSTG
jgi:hypothetical protein